MHFNRIYQFWIVILFLFCFLKYNNIFLFIFFFACFNQHTQAVDKLHPILEVLLLVVFFQNNNLFISVFSKNKSLF